MLRDCVMRPRILLLLLLTAGFIAAHAQTRVIDSLRKKIHTALNDQERLDAIYLLAQQDLNPDSLLIYLHIAEPILTRYTDKKNQEKFSISQAYYYIRKNFVDSALAITNALVDEYRNSRKDASLYLSYIFFKAKLLDRGGQYTQSLTQLSEVVEKAESLKDTLIQIQAKTGIGWVQMEMGQYHEALQWLYNALHTSSNKKFYANYGALYSNIASVYNSLHQPDSARHYIEIAISNARDNENYFFLATALSMQAKIFIDAGQPQLAEQPLHEVVELRKQLNDPYFIVYDMSNLASYYAANKQPEKGIELCLKGIEIVKQEGLASQLLMVYSALAENYKAAGNNKLYGETLEHVIALKDSFNNINSSKQLAELKATSEAAKKEKQIIEQKLSIDKRNYLLYGSAIFGIMAAIITWLAFKNYHRKQQIKISRAIEDEKKIAAKAISDAEEQERKRIAADLHDNLGAYAASMVSNLDHISLHPIHELTVAPLQELRRNSQAIVSQLGDTIWALKKDSLSLTAISDRIKVFIQRIQPSYPRVTIDVLEDISYDHLLSPSHAFHLFRISQEAITNALKHSQCKKIIVRVEAHADWQIVIEDDGKGWQPANESSYGNGIQNMKTRAHEAGWQIHWNSEEQKGVQVIIQPTTN